MANILIIDIETAPKLAYVWRFFKENIGAKQVVDHGHIMSFAAKWLDKDYVIYEDNRLDDDSQILESIVSLFNRADIVIAHNAIGFDVPSINGRCLVAGIAPPAPYKIVDTLREARKNFLFESNSLEYLAKILNCKPKEDHKNFPGFLLWTECLKGNPLAWDEMETYNIQDVITLEEIYLKMRPWIKAHPNVGLFDEEAIEVCPKCGSTHLQKRGYAVLAAGKYQRYRCNDCGGWSRDNTNLFPKEKRVALIRNVL